MLKKLTNNEKEGKKAIEEGRAIMQRLIIIKTLFCITYEKNMLKLHTEIIFLHAVCLCVLFCFVYLLRQVVEFLKVLNS